MYNPSTSEICKNIFTTRHYDSMIISGDGNISSSTECDDHRIKLDDVADYIRTPTV